MQENKLFRSKTDRKIAGVCEGFAEFFGMDPTIVRLLYLFVTFYSLFRSIDLHSISTDPSGKISIFPVYHSLQKRGLEVLNRHNRNTLPYDRRKEGRQACKLMWLP
ncbi:MAG: PspC domain-containing protein [Porphyromonas sp.]|nr:PspC domain-containing protein [Porphyromonas sp.]